MSLEILIPNVNFHNNIDICVQSIRPPLLILSIRPPLLILRILVGFSIILEYPGAIVRMLFKHMITKFEQHQKDESLRF
jgi:hypothetical protein